MEGKSKVSKLLLIIIVVLVLIILGLSGYIVYEKVILGSTESEKNYDINDDEDVDRLSQTEKNEISGMISQIVFKGVRGVNDNYIPSDDEQFPNMPTGFNSQMFIDFNVNDFDKALVALNLVRGKSESTGREQKSEEEVKKIYENYFGSEWKDIDLTALGSCPTYSYDDVNRVFNADSACGGSTSTAVILHKENYIIKDGVVSVDIYVANLVGNMDSTAYILTSELSPNYESLDSSKIISTVNSTPKYVLTNEDKNKVNKYKMIFKKNSDKTFYFHSITN